MKAKTKKDVSSLILAAVLFYSYFLYGDKRLNYVQMMEDRIHDKQQRAAAMIEHATPTESYRELMSIEPKKFLPLVDCDSCFLPATVEEVEEFKDKTVSIIIPAHFEKAHLAKTVGYIFAMTPLMLVEEILIIDDESREEPVEETLKRGYTEDSMFWLTQEMQRRIRVIRNDKRQGLIRGKIQGVSAAKGTFVFFLDGHCRPITHNWLQLLVRAIGERNEETGDYEKIAVPGISTLDTDWKDLNMIGTQMIFLWDFEFDWYHSKVDEVAIQPGGIALLSKEFFFKLGAYDEGMLEWGGENLEQSFRFWMCGGSIQIVRKSVMGHIFGRAEAKLKDRVTDDKVVPRNKARAARIWLDDYYEVFTDALPKVKELDTLGPKLLDRALMRFEKRCNNFSWYMDKFSDVFERRALFVKRQHSIRHIGTGLCLTAGRRWGHEKREDKELDEKRKALQLWGTDGEIVEIGNAPDGKNGGMPYLRLTPCEGGNSYQRFGFINGGKRLVNEGVKARPGGSDRYCIDLGNIADPKHPILYQCDHGVNNNQIFRFTAGTLQNFGRTFETKNTETVGRFVNTGRDRMVSKDTSAAILRDMGGKCLVYRPPTGETAEYFKDLRRHAEIGFDGDLIRGGYYYDVKIEKCTAGERADDPMLMWDWIA